MACISEDRTQTVMRQRNTKSAMQARARPGRAEVWHDWFGKLQAFHRQFGHISIPSQGRHARLYHWLYQQLCCHRRGELAPQRLEQLQTLGFPPERIYPDHWMKQYVRLAAYAKRHGHANVPAKDPDRSLARWVGTQRGRWRGTDSPLTPNQRTLLAELPLCMNPMGEFWEMRLARLKRFLATYGHLDVPKGWPEDPRLKAWLTDQRYLYHSGKLLSRHGELLAQVSRKWLVPSRRLRSWEERLKQIAAFKAAHGHCQIRQCHKEFGGLGGYAQSLRQARRRGRLAAGRIAQLDALGFAWKLKKEPHLWMRRLKELARFITKHGHCDVRRTSLAAFVSRMRKLHARGELSAERIAELEALHFDWEGAVTREWNKHMADLAAFKAKYGHCNVAQSDFKDQRLWRFVSYMRRKYWSGRLLPQYQAQLEAMGFVWRRPQGAGNGHLHQWRRRLRQLAAFKARHGHCEVPKSYEKITGLDDFVQAMCQQRRRGTLPAGLVAKLDAMGFTWQVRRGRR